MGGLRESVARRPGYQMMGRSGNHSCLLKLNSKTY